MARPRHPIKEIEEVVAYAESLGWRVEMQGHWGRLYCPQADRDGCQIGVWSTPRNAQNHAKQVRRRIDSCPHQDKETEDDRV